MSNREDDNDQNEIKHNVDASKTRRIRYNAHLKKSQDISEFELIVAALTILSLIIILVVYLEKLTPAQLQILYLFDLCVTIVLGIDYTFRLIRLFRILSYFGDSQLLYIAFFISITTVSGAISIYLVESPVSNSDIKTLGDSFWWSVGIVSTIAPNNLSPVTTEGQIIASVLMFVSIGVIAILISTLGSKLVQSRLKESKSIRPGETMFIKESKEDIKRKIDKIEDLNSQELDLLFNIIVSTHNTLQFQQQQTHLQSSNSFKIDKNTPQDKLQDKKESKEKNQNKHAEDY